MALPSAVCYDSPWRAVWRFAMGASIVDPPNSINLTVLSSSPLNNTSSCHEEAWNKNMMEAKSRAAFQHRFPDLDNLPLEKAPENSIIDEYRTFTATLVESYFKNPARIDRKSVV